MNGNHEYKLDRRPTRQVVVLANTADGGNNFDDDFPGLLLAGHPAGQTRAEIEAPARFGK